MEWDLLVEMLSKNPQPLPHTDVWLRLIHTLLEQKMDLTRLPQDAKHLRSVLESTQEWTSYSVAASDFLGEDPKQVKLILPLLKPVEHARNVVHEIYDMYVNTYDHLLFEPALHRYNPLTRQTERYYSHPVTSEWFNTMYNNVKLRFGPKVRLVVAHIYSDSTLAADGAHHPVYLQLANATLEHYQSSFGKRCIGLIPAIPTIADLSDSALAHLRTCLFHIIVGKFIAPFRDAFLKVVLASSHLWVVASL
jgi:hypothetical protein